MNWFFKALFRPVENRYYNPRHHLKGYILLNLPTAVIGIVLGVVANPWFFRGLLLIPADYFLLDRMRDTLFWKGMSKRFYSDEVHENSEEHVLMEKFEKNPSPENYQKLHEKVTKPNI